MFNSNCHCQRSIFSGVCGGGGYQNVLVVPLDNYVMLEYNVNKMFNVILSVKLEEL